MSDERKCTAAALIILDGYGHSKQREYNAVLQASTPVMDGLVKALPHTLITASGTRVGLPSGVMGNSEVGHMNLGAGRVCPQPLVQLNEALVNGTFQTNPVLTGAIDRAVKGRRKLHLMGLVSDGGVHSHLNHLMGILRMAASRGLGEVYLHAFLDGRDTPPRSAGSYLKTLDDTFTRLGIGTFATIMGRYYGMDRDRKWDRTEAAYAAIVMGQGRRARSALSALGQAYADDVSDEYVEPTVISSAWGRPVATVEDGDSVILFNFRADRARQLSAALVNADFEGFHRKYFPKVHLVCMTEYDRSLGAPVAFDKPAYRQILGEHVSGLGLRQLRIAETEKYAHVTFFFNATREEPFPGEDRELVPSPGVPHYDEMPRMSAEGITAKLEELVPRAAHDLYVVNFANPDMVGHTGNLDAAILAVEEVDRCLGRIVPLFREAGVHFIITADHGNAEVMHDRIRDAPHTAHTTNPVPLLVSRKDAALREGGALCDVAPTLLELMGLGRPEEMEGRSLLKL